MSSRRQCPHDLSRLSAHFEGLSHASARAWSDSAPLPCMHFDCSVSFKHRSTPIWRLARQLWTYHEDREPYSLPCCYTNSLGGAFRQFYADPRFDERPCWTRVDILEDCWNSTRIGACRTTRVELWKSSSDLHTVFSLSLFCSLQWSLFLPWTSCKQCK